jgi:hypothetical protein
MSDQKRKEPGETCNARKTDGSGYCGHRAGWGTDHVGHGRCKYHGGDSPNGEKSVLNDLEDAAEHAAVAYKLKLKEIRRKAENGEIEAIDWQELDRLGRAAFDRTGHGPSKEQKLTGGGDDGEIMIDWDNADT